MLRELHIKHYAIVDELSLQLSDGFNVITGETGAGKSILVGALSLVLGERSSLEGVRQGCTEALLEAAFELSPPLKKRLLSSEQAVFQDEDDLHDPLIFKRILSKTGKNRAYLNGSMATLANLRAVGQVLVTVHGQQGQQGQSLLLDVDWQREVLDVYGNLTSRCDAYEACYGQWLVLRQKKKSLEKTKAERRDAAEMRAFHLSVLSEAHLEPDEEAELEKEEKKLRNWAQVFSETQEAHTLLCDDLGILNQLEQVGSALNRVLQLTEEGEHALELCQNAQICLNELSDQVRESVQAEPADPDRLEWVAARLFELQELKRKYRRSFSELLSYREALEAELSEDMDDRNDVTAIEKALVETEKVLNQKASDLSQERAKTGEALAIRVMQELKGLGMDKTRFHVVLQSIPFMEKGIDAPSFCISLPGEKEEALGKIASGGELSRMMLALKVVLAEIDPVPTLLFDEIDAGVGGGIAEKIGRRLSSLSKQHQVLCITHHPQIAALADHHYHVEKIESNGRMVTSLRALSQEERIDELARMLGGVTTTDLSRQHAKEMMAGK